VEIKGKKAVVFGGASGMGRATAELLAARGADVAVIDRPGSGGEEIAKSFGADFHACDITDFTGTEEVLAAAVDRLGGLHVCVTTAGGGIAKRTLGKGGPHDLESFRAVLDLNAVATFNISRLAAAHMAANEPADDERGVIVNTASIAAFDGQIGQIAYAASKGGIVSMTLPAARDLAPLGVRVCAIAPGVFDTPLLGALPEDAREELGRNALFPARFGQPHEFAALVAHIVENEMLNGEVIRLDGALRMPPR
jgi:NAD(P)-dependent dehydrogenase (short-subunit alcohol dehydrogenase family)